jgi:hypothetical protein
MGEFLREARQQLDRGEREKLLRSTLRKLESQEFRRCEESHPT